MRRSEAGEDVDRRYGCNRKTSGNQEYELWSEGFGEMGVVVEIVWSNSTVSGGSTQRTSMYLWHEE